jgi:hypothetical protein
LLSTPKFWVTCYTATDKKYRHWIC